MLKVVLEISVVIIMLAGGVYQASAGEREEYYLDNGFMGRAVKLEVLNKSNVISWQAGDLLGPVQLSVARLPNGKINLIWSDPDKVTRAPKVYMKTGVASWYRYKNCRCAASPDFPKGSRVRVRSLKNPLKYTVVRINDYGPERDKHPDRVIDLDAVAFKELAPLGAGLIKVTVEPL